MVKEKIYKFNYIKNENFSSANIIKVERMREDINTVKQGLSKIHEELLKIKKEKRQSSVKKEKANKLEEERGNLNVQNQKKY